MLVFFACGVGFGIVVLIGAIVLAVWWLARKGDCSIVVGKNGSIRWHGDA